MRRAEKQLGGGWMRQYVESQSTIKIVVDHPRTWKVLWRLSTCGKGQFWRRPKLVARHSETQTGCPITYPYTSSKARDLCERYGFHITETQVEHIFTYRISNYVRCRYARAF